ncbi:Spx/MgsR family RNA polymerase-binding regulatory protein [Enterococcus lactis]|uniref:Spx/MgsR family RNA polymerase-binding regulatory protein n=1 Tax=Enterococcus lactis TaxID=357441 RepID=UPI002380A226|nr:Spx/MgsR family RNA polymerase-binding regulatory protein [Enterococcus lactis]MDE3907457.1 Spx/MgsR family RNA polymerase-binding regulatory protein [Enterococcus lactis]
MIKVYTSPSCTSCRKARAWLQANQLEFEEKNIFAEPLTESEIKKILAATEGGVQDIISTRSKIYEKLGIDFNELTLKQMIVLFKEYSSLLRRPILIDEKRILIGFNEDEIRSFVPREIRCVARNLIYLQNNNILNS